MPEDRLSPVPFPSLASRFAVVEEFGGGEGWSGAVRELIDPSTTYVLKVLDAGFDAREASVLASLAHPRIPRILEIGDAGDGRAFMLRAYQPGVPLSTCLPLTPSEVVDLAIQLLEILTFVHLRGILHLDIKPANVLRDDASGSAQYSLLDFGLGGRRDDVAGGGTPFYIAPERLLGLRADERTDLYSLGATLYRALRVSQAPLPLVGFAARSLEDGFFGALGVAPADLPAPFDRVLPRLVARDPKDRYLDAQEALEAVAGRSGRPSLAMLMPDPIALHGERLASQLARVPANSSVELAGGDAATRVSLALHVACELARDVGYRVGRDGDRVLLAHADAAPDRAPERCEIEAAAAQPLTAHLHHQLGLAMADAHAIAAGLLERDISTAAHIGEWLCERARSGQIVPDGARWAWPTASAGRPVFDDDAPRELPTTVEAIRAAAAHGRIELAMAGYRVLVRDEACAATTDRALRAALAEGLCAGGEPARALPLSGDLPIHRARALLDLGRVDAARALLESTAQQSAVSLLSSEALRERTFAAIEFASGQLDRAHERLVRLIDADADPAHRIVFGQVLLARGDVVDAQRLYEALVTELERGAQGTFLLAAALTGRAEAHRRAGERAAALVDYERAEVLLHALGHVRHCATAATNLGVIAKDSDDFERALEMHRRARALYEHVGDLRGVGFAVANLGITSLAMGDHSNARERLRDALDRFDAIGSFGVRPLVMVRLARAEFELGATDTARELLDRLPEDAPSAVGHEAEALRAAIEHACQDESDDAIPERSTIAEHPAMPPAPANSGVSKEVFRTFLAVNRRLAGEVDLDRAMAHLVDAAVTLTGGRHGYLLVSRDGNLIREFYTDRADTESLAFSRSMVNRAVSQRRIQTADDVVDDRELMDMPSVRNLRQRSAICVPFRSAAGNEGAIYVEHPGRAGVFGDAEKEHLEVLADQAAIAVDRMLHEEALARELEQSRRELAVVKRGRRAAASPVKMLGKSAPMRALRAQIAKIADSPLSVLVVGETGSGKELVAHAVHDESSRSRCAFVAENCSAIPEQLMESELFGHMKGAFTGADDDRAGLLELASGGTLFLDEIGDMPLVLQTKLLRALQERSIRRVGGTKSIPIDIRLVSATHKDLRAMVAEGTFREDLYYRIVAVEIRVPPLRERASDIEILTDAILAELNRQHRRAVRLSPAARDELAAYAWPGNVRELHHVVSRAFILAESDVIDDLVLPRSVAPRAPGSPPPEGGPSLAQSSASITAWPAMPLHEAERRTILAALQATGGDKTKAARLLEVSRTALYEKLKRIRGRDAGPDDGDAD